ncbi:MAG TPA: MBOAT family protein, partial [Phycisphaerae bacterium]|nr:MBOAT family protein [Phycisphaerae bacterium]
MLFNSFQFAAFFVAIYALYCLTLRRVRVQNVLLLIASYFFYGCWDWRFLALIALSTVIDYVVGGLLDRRSGEGTGAYAYGSRARQVLLATSVVANLGILGVFKYYDFFAAQAGTLLAGIGLPWEPRFLHVILPVGISFYTFQTLSYTIDVYRDEIRACGSFVDFATFVAFFPQLVAGPIVRARDFLPQVRAPRHLDAAQFGEGGYLVLWGLFKKVVIAGNLATLVDGVFSAAPGAYSGGAVVVAVYAFAVQIYCDFSGYTDIARGCAKMMGFELMLNFNLPYFARNPADFWRRWHISLSTWLRDYLYIPLGGNRKGPRRTLINLALTMLLGGLWHGAAWTFVLWGAYQGGLLIVHRLAMPALNRWTQFKSQPVRAAWNALVIVVFFQFVCVGWLIFRAESVGQIADMAGAVLGGVTLAHSGLRTLVFYAAPLVVLQLLQYFRDDLDA